MHQYPQPGTPIGYYYYYYNLGHPVQFIITTRNSNNEKEQV
jgi:hypothetical protein